MPEAWRVEMRRGLRRLRAGEFARAEVHFARAHRWAPDRPEVLAALGRERLRQGDVAEAARLLEAAWRGDPTLISVAAAWARCLGVHLARPDDARTVLDQAGGDHDPLLLLVRAEVEVEAGHAAAAMAAAEAAMAAADSDGERASATAALARAHNLAGMQRAAAGELEAALFVFRRAAALDPGWSGPHVNMGAAFARLGRRDRARAAYRQAIALDPGNPVAHYDLGLLLAGDGDPGEAAAALAIACELDPDLDAAGAALAGCAAARPDAVIAALTARVERRPERAAAWVDLATAFAATNDPGGAEPCLRRALELDPAHRGALRRLADLLVRDSRYLEAAVLAQAAQREPGPAESS